VQATNPLRKCDAGVQTGPPERLGCRCHIGIRNIRENKVLPHRQPDFAGPIEVGDFKRRAAFAWA